VKVMLDCNNIHYYRNRAVEAITNGEYILAIQLLVMAIGMKYGPVQSQGKKKTRNTSPEKDVSLPKS
jgi:hypothetical protein